MSIVRHVGSACIVIACMGAIGCSSSPTTADTLDDGCSAADTSRVPINDLGHGCYLGFVGGLYGAGENAIPLTHRAAGVAAAARIEPVDINGQPSSNGKYVLLSVGMSNTTQEFCSGSGTPGSCEPWSFMGQAAADPTVNHTTLVLVNGARGGQTAAAWANPASAEYDRIRDQWLVPLGLSEKQVQIAWVKVANAQPRTSLPDSAADAYALVRQTGDIMRALKSRYPNLRQAFLSSRIYAGYATTTLNPEPYAYESAFAVQRAIASQIAQMSGGSGDARTGSLRYDNVTAAWMAWGPYLWAAGTRPRSDGLTWLAADFASDGTHPAQGARQKVGAMLLSFFKASEVTRCWFLSGQRCAA